MEAKKHYMYFDLLSIVACLAVIFLHCNGIVHSGPGVRHWSQALVFEVIFYWAVPIFFMCTGAKTFKYRDKRTTKEFLLTRIKGIFVPFVAWSLIQYLIISFGGGLLESSSQEWKPSFIHFMTQFMNCQIDGTYWFFFSMFGVTLSIPVLSRLRDETSTLWYLVIAYVTLSGIMVPLAKVIGLPWNPAIEISVAGGYVMYVVLGYLLANDNTVFIKKNSRLTLYLLGLCGLIVRYAYTWYFSQSSGTLDNTLFGYNYITAILPSVAVFVFFKYVDWEKNALFSHRAASIKEIAGLTFGIYLMHNLVLSKVFLGLLHLDMSSYFVRLVLPFVIFFMCLMLSKLINKIPYVRAIVGGWR